MPQAEAPFLRFMRSYKKNPETGCWDWTGGLMTNGYGRIKVFGKWMGAHQLAHTLYKGPIPDGLEVLHSCDNKRCVNPDHIRAGTHAENMVEARERIAWKPSSISPEKRKRPRQARPVMVLGQPYESMNAAERALGLGSGTVGYWIGRGNGKAKPISSAEYASLVTT